MSRVRFIMVGGFLGAGKTTAMARLARHFTDQGLRVGLVTNDQAYGLVDTQSLRAQGFHVGEVTGACFCCKFNDLIDTVGQLAAEELPQVILTEPVGSCTDLVATVIEPLRQFYGDSYDIAPLTVLLKPEHGSKILGGESGVGFSPKAAYIFLKQLEEADVIVLNKTDKLSDAARQQLLDQVRQRFPGKPVLAVSSRNGDGFESLIEAVSQPLPAGRSTMEVDYDVYAEGEAELGWLNAEVRLRGGAFAVDNLLLELVERLDAACTAIGAEPAHLKVLTEAEGEAGIANLVGSGVGAELSRASAVTCSEATITVNARVAVDPEKLTEMLAQAVADLARAHALDATIENVQSFRPGRPTPTHRLRLVASGE